MFTCNMFSVFVFRGFVVLVVCCVGVVVLFWFCLVGFVAGEFIDCAWGVCLVGVLFVVPVGAFWVCWGQ